MSKPNIASILGRLQGGQCNSDDYFAIVELLNDRERLIEASIATPPAQQPGEGGEAKAGAHHVRAATELLSSLKSEQLTYSIDGEHEIAASMTTMIEAVAIAVDMFTAALAPKEKGNGPA